MKDHIPKNILSQYVCLFVIQVNIVGGIQKKV